MLNFESYAFLRSVGLKALARMAPILIRVSDTQSFLSLLKIRPGLLMARLMLEVRRGPTMVMVRLKMMMLVNLSGK